MPSLINATTTNGLVTSADNSGSLQLQTNNGTTAVTIDTSQNVGIGTTSPARRLTVKGSTGIAAERDIDTDRLIATYNDINCYANATGANNYNTLTFTQSNNSGSNERMRITSGGNLLVGTTTNTNTCRFKTEANGTNVNAEFYQPSTSSYTSVIFTNPNGTVGSITTSASATTYATSSDYRLKENIAPMQGALNVVQQLKPVTYNWKIDGSSGQGFIAHELAEVVPDCVTGEKDAVDEEGKPVYQGVDTSFLVATLTAAIQEQQAQIEELKAKVSALEGVK